MALENIANQYSGLDMGALIGGPLKASCDAQTTLAMSTVNFIQEVGFHTDNGISKTRVADFSFDRTVMNGKDELGNPIYEKEEVKMSVPLLAMVNVPSLMIQDVDISFDMEVSSSESSENSKDKSGSMSGSATFSLGGFLKGSASIAGKVSTYSSNTRKSDNSAKYHVEVKATQGGTPEGLSRVLDIIAAAVAPTAVEGPQARADKKIMAQLQPEIDKKRQLTRQLGMKQIDLANLKQELAIYENQDQEASESAKDQQVIISRDDIRTSIQEKLKTL